MYTLCRNRELLLYGDFFQTKHFAEIENCFFFLNIYLIIQARWNKMKPRLLYSFPPEKNVQTRLRLTCLVFQFVLKKRNKCEKFFNKIFTKKWRFHILFKPWQLICGVYIPILDVYIIYQRLLKVSTSEKEMSLLTYICMSLFHIYICTVPGMCDMIYLFILAIL